MSFAPLIGTIESTCQYPLKPINKYVCPIRVYLRSRFGIRDDHLVVDELHGRQALWTEHGGELFDVGGLGVDPIGLDIAEDEDVDEARRVLTFLPDLVAQGSGLAARKPDGRWNGLGFDDAQ